MQFHWNHQVKLMTLGSGNFSVTQKFNVEMADAGA